MMEQQQLNENATTTTAPSSPDEQKLQAKEEGKQRETSSPTSSMQKAEETDEGSVKSEDDKSEEKKRSADQAELPEASAAAEEEEEEEEDDEDYALDQNRFPDKVRYLLDEQVAPNAIWWLPEGDALAVNKDAFSMQLLIRHFRGNKFSSVTRNFNRWGFRRVPEERVPDGVLGYTHDMFQRDRRGLLKKMKKEVYVKKDKDPNKESGDEGDKPRPKKKQKTNKKAKASSSSGLGSAAHMNASHMLAAASHMGSGGLGLGMARAAAPSAQGRSYSPDLHSRLLADLSASSGIAAPSLLGAGAGSLRDSLAMPPSALDAHGLSIQRLFEQNQADALASLQSERNASSGMPSYAALAMAQRLRAGAGHGGAGLASDPFRDTSSLASFLQRTPAASSSAALPPASALQSLLMDRRERANQDAVLQQLARQRQLEALQQQQRRESASENLADLLSSRSVLPDQLLSNPGASAAAGLNNPDLLGRSLLDARRRALEAEHREAVLMAAAAGRRQPFHQQDALEQLLDGNRSSLRNTSVRGMAAAVRPGQVRDLAAEEQKELQQQDLIQQMLGVQGVSSLGRGGDALQRNRQREPEEHKRLG